MARKRRQAERLGDEAAVKAAEQFSKDVADVKPMTPEEIRSVSFEAREDVDPYPDDIPQVSDVFDAAIAAQKPRTASVSEDNDLRRESGADQRAPDETPRRSWSRRYPPSAARYERFVTLDANRHQKIMFRFDLEPGCDKPAPEVLAVVQEQKGTELGHMARFGYRPDRVNGKVWTMDNSPAGRELADKIMAKLDEIGWKSVSQERGR